MNIFTHRMNSAYYNFTKQLAVYHWGPMMFLGLKSFNEVMALSVLSVTDD